MSKPGKYQPECDRLIALGHKLKWGLYLFLATNEQPIALLNKKQGNYDSNLQEVVANMILIPKFVMSVRDLLAALIREDKVYGYIFPIIRLLAVVQDLDIIKDAHRKDIAIILLRHISGLQRNTQSSTLSTRTQQNAQAKQENTPLGSPEQGLPGSMGKRLFNTSSGTKQSHRWTMAMVPSTPAAPDNIGKRGVGPEGEEGNFAPSTSEPEETNFQTDNSEGFDELPKMVPSSMLILEMQTVFNWYEHKNSGILTIRSG